MSASLHFTFLHPLNVYNAQIPYYFCIFTLMHVKYDAARAICRQQLYMQLSLFAVGGQRPLQAIVDLFIDPLWLGFIGWHLPPRVSCRIHGLKTCSVLLQIDSWSCMHLLQVVASNLLVPCTITAQHRYYVSCLGGVNVGSPCLYFLMSRDIGDIP